MKIDVLDINEMVETEDLKEVSNAVYFNAGSLPTSDGLFSTEIFGEVGSEERRRNFAYISLNGKFLQPIVYKILTTLDHKIESIIAGNNYYSIDSTGNLVEDPNGDTGLDFLYNNYERIIFKSSDSEQRRTKLKLLAKLKKDEVFIDKFVVIPASLRDYNPSKVSGSRISDVDPLNELYVRIIRAASNLTNSSFSFVTNTSKMQIQLTLVEIYSMLTELLAHKNGIIRKRLMGKSVDYATRSVITAPRFTTDKWEDNPIKFGYTGIPLSQVAVLLYPFFVKYIEDFIELHKESFTRIKKKNGEVIIIDDIEQQFSDKNINKMIDNYIKNIEGRFDSLKVKDKTGTYHNVDVYREDLNRQFTFTDLLYIAAIDICEDKHVYVTRYPVENFRLQCFLEIYSSRIMG